MRFLFLVLLSYSMFATTYFGKYLVGYFHNAEFVWMYSTNDGEEARRMKQHCNLKGKPCVVVKNGTWKKVGIQ